MGNLSEHFNKEDFACHCGRCQKEFSISLTLVGILEDLCNKLQTKIQIKQAFVCEDAEVKEPGPKKNYHGGGKAVDFSLEKEKLAEAFRYLETFPEITGLGIDPVQNYIHVDLREKEPVKWIYLQGEQTPLDAGLREKYQLGAEVSRTVIPKPLTLDLPVEV